MPIKPFDQKESIVALAHAINSLEDFTPGVMEVYADYVISGVEPEYSFSNTAVFERRDELDALRDKFSDMGLSDAEIAGVFESAASSKEIYGYVDWPAALNEICLARGEHSMFSSHDGRYELANEYIELFPVEVSRSFAQQVDQAFAQAPSGSSEFTLDEILQAGGFNSQLEFGQAPQSAAENQADQIQQPPLAGGRTR